MGAEPSLILATAATIAVLHTALGPDHYLPFVAMAKARGWGAVKTASVTALCGFGHAMGSVLLGLIGVSAGVAVAKLEWFESSRGELAAWALIAFGLVYLAWGLKRAKRRHAHSHLHAHADGTVHTHHHSHDREHVHVHDVPGKAALVPWSLFLIFILGPCEPMIPLMMAPMAAGDVFGLVAVVATYTAVTLATMLAIVFAALKGLSFAGGGLARYGHALAGGVVAMCGFAMAFLGL